MPSCGIASQGRPVSHAHSSAGPSPHLPRLSQKPYANTSCHPSSYKDDPWTSLSRVPGSHHLGISGPSLIFIKKNYAKGDIMWANVGPPTSCLAKYNVKTNKYHHSIFHKRNVLTTKGAQRPSGWTKGERLKWITMKWMSRKLTTLALLFSFCCQSGKKMCQSDGTDPQMQVAASPLCHLLQTCQLLSTCPLPPWTQHLLDSSRIPQEAPGRASKPCIICVLWDTPHRPVTATTPQNCSSFSLPLPAQTHRLLYLDSQHSHL